LFKINYIVQTLERSSYWQEDIVDNLTHNCAMLRQLWSDPTCS